MKKQIPYKKFISWQTKIFQESCKTSQNYKHATANTVLSDMRTFMGIIYRCYYEIEGEQMVMTNKLLSKDNHYSSSTICFIPRRILSVINNLDVAKVKYMPLKRVYKASLMLNGVLTSREFKTERNAIKWVKREKLNYLIDFINEYEKVLPSNVYLALCEIVESK